MATQRQANANIQCCFYLLISRGNFFHIPEQNIWRSENNISNVSRFFSFFFFFCSMSAASTMRQTWRQAERGDSAGQNVFRVPNRLCFTRLNSFADCHNTDLLLTQRKWPLSTTLKWPGGEHETPALKIQQTIADSMFVRIWEGGKCVLDNLNGFGLNTTYFDSSISMTFFAGRRAHTHTWRQKHILQRDLSEKQARNRGWKE